MDLSELIERNAAFTPDKPATIFEGETLSYRALSARIEQTARALKAEFGVGRCDRAAILSLNRPDYLVLLFTYALLPPLLRPATHALSPAYATCSPPQSSVHPRPPRTIHPRLTPAPLHAHHATTRPTSPVLGPPIIPAVPDPPPPISTALPSLKAVPTGSTIVPPHLIE